MARTHDSAWVRRYWDQSAAKYDSSNRWFERFFVGDGRSWVASRAHGDVLEIGIGTGRSLPFYPADARLTGIDISPAMLEQARARAREQGRNVDLRVGDAQALEFDDATFDTVVFSLALCSIPDDVTAVREARRVLRPGARIVLIEHVRSPSRPVRALQRLLDIFTVRLQGDHLLREPLDHLVREGMVVEVVERSALGVIERVVARTAS